MTFFVPLLMQPESQRGVVCFSLCLFAVVNWRTPTMKIVSHQIRNTVRFREESYQWESEQINVFVSPTSFRSFSSKWIEATFLPPLECFYEMRSSPSFTVQSVIKPHGTVLLISSGHLVIFRRKGDKEEECLWIDISWHPLSLGDHSTSLHPPPRPPMPRPLISFTQKQFSLVFRYFSLQTLVVMSSTWHALQTGECDVLGVLGGRGGGVPGWLQETHTHTQQ